jgi:hypothetical protein
VFHHVGKGWEEGVGGWRLAGENVLPSSTSGKSWEEGVGVPGGGRSGRTGKGVLGRVSGWQSERLVFQHVTTDWEEGCQGCLAAGRGAGKKLEKVLGGCVWVKKLTGWSIDKANICL